MSERNFREMLEAKWAEGKFVCVGLDTDLSKTPECLRCMGDAGDRIRAFNQRIVDVTKDLVCAYKPNTAFYEAHGNEGFCALRDTIKHINSAAPDVPVILDAKRADIGNTNEGYVKMAFDYFKADAITLHPYLGKEALKPFLDLKDKGIVVLCRTSNPGAGEFQDITIDVDLEEGEFIAKKTGSWCLHNGAYTRPFYLHVAYQVSRKWNGGKNCALVVGATYPRELETVRKIVGDMPILIPGIGAQGGDLEKTVSAGKDSRSWGMIINSSRGIIFASPGTDFAEAARIETLKLHILIAQYLKGGSS